MSGQDLHCRGLTKRWGSTTVLDDVDLHVRAGTSLVLLGTSGAGKTTLLRIVAGLDRADGGVVQFGGRVLSDPAVRVPPERRGIGVVFQALELWPQMTVAEHLAFGLWGRPCGRRARHAPAVLDAAEQVGLAAALLGRRPGTLSGGEQQRVAIARTLAAEPDVILYDEPLANLDPGRRRALRALIRRLARQHRTTLVYVTHDAEEALEIGDEVAVMADGRVVERGVPAEVYAHPRTLRGARALGPVSVLPGHADGTHVVTALGTYPAPGAAAGPCRVLWRPEALQPASVATPTVRVVDVVARGADWGFTAQLGTSTLEGRSPTRLDVGQILGLEVAAPAAVLAAASLTAGAEVYA